MKIKIRVPHEDAVYDRVGNILMTRLMGCSNGWRRVMGGDG